MLKQLVSPVKSIREPLRIGVSRQHFAFEKTMDINIYQTCPCHTDKKIKFCCGKAIVGDLSRIVDLSVREQSVAALNHVDRTISRLGRRDCLSTMRAHILLSLGELDTAREENQQFLTRNPRAAIGYQHRAMLLAESGESNEAVEALQDAIDLLPGLNVPLSIASAFRMTAISLLKDDKLIAATEHLVFASNLVEDPGITELLRSVRHSGEVPLMHKSRLNLSLPDDFAPPEWAEAGRNAVRFAWRGRWRAALQRLQKLDADFPNQPWILRAIAALQTWLGRTGDAVKTLAEYAGSDQLPFDDRAETFALAFAISREPRERELDVVRLAYPVLEASRLGELLVSNRRLIAYRNTGSHLDSDERAPDIAGIILDRDRLDDSQDDEVDEERVPLTIGRFSVFGKRTDRPGMMHLVLTGTPDLDEIANEFRHWLGTSIGPESEREVVNRVGEFTHELTREMNFPATVSARRRQEISARSFERLVMETFPTTPFPALGGRTPAEAAKEEERDRALIAGLILLIENDGTVTFRGSFDFDRIRDKLNIPRREPLAAAEKEKVIGAPLALQRMDLTSLDDMNLVAVFAMAMEAGNLRVLRPCAHELLSRPHIDKNLNHEQLYMILASATFDDDEAIELIHKARQSAVSHDRGVGRILVFELEQRMKRNLTDGLEELLHTLETRYMEDPRIRYAVSQVLEKFGLRLGGPRPAEFDDEGDEALPVSAGDSALWTPDQESGGSGTREKSGLWLPD